MKKFYIIIFLILGFLFIGCGNPVKIDMSENWKYKVFDWDFSTKIDNSYALNEFDDSAWENLEKLPAAIIKERKKSVIWLRKEIVIPETYRGKELGIYLGKVWDQEYTYLNGKKIGSCGREYPEFHSAWNESASHYFPGGLINYGGKNIISIRQFTNQQANFNGKPFIGLYYDVGVYNFKQRLVAEYLPMIFGFMTLLLGFGMISLYLMSKDKNILNLLMGIISAIWFILTTHFWFPNYSILPWNLQDQLFYVFTAILVGLIYFYLEISLNVKLRWGRILIIVVGSAVCLLSLTATVEDPITGWRFDLIAPIGLIGQFLWGVIIIKSIRNKNKEAKIMLIGYIVFALSIVHDGLMMNRIIMSTAFMVNIAYPFLVLSFAIILLRRILEVARKLKKSTVIIEKNNLALKQIFDEVVKSTDELIDISVIVNSSTGDLKNNMDKQSGSLQSASAVIEEMSSSILAISDNASEQAGEVEKSSHLLGDYSDSLDNITQAARNVVELGEKSSLETKEITLKLNDITERMTSLKDSTDSIENIATIINEIAEKTNLLSLNASIEAARAGESGRGFAVVADEIGKLADGSLQQSKIIQQIIKEIVEVIERETDAIVKSSKSVEDIDESVNNVNVVSDSILKLCVRQVKLTDNLKEYVKHILNGASEISNATNEQTNAMEEVLSEVAVLSDITSKVNENSDKMVDVSGQLSHRIAILNKIIVDN